LTEHRNDVVMTTVLLPKEKS